MRVSVEVKDDNLVYIVFPSTNGTLLISLKFDGVTFQRPLTTMQEREALLQARQVAEAFLEDHDIRDADRI